MASPASRVCCPTGAWASSMRWLFWSSQATLRKIKEGTSYRPPSILLPASIARPDRFVVG